MDLKRKEHVPCERLYFGISHSKRRHHVTVVIFFVTSLLKISSSLKILFLFSFLWSSSFIIQKDPWVGTAIFWIEGVLTPIISLGGIAGDDDDGGGDDDDDGDDDENSNDLFMMNCFHFTMIQEMSSASSSSQSATAPLTSSQASQIFLFVW